MLTVSTYHDEISAVEYDPKEKLLIIELEEDGRHMQILDAQPTTLEDMYFAIINSEEHVTIEWLKYATEWRWV